MPSQRLRSTDEKIELLALAERLGNVSRACRMIGMSRDSYYRLRKHFGRGGLLALEAASPHRPVVQNRVDPDVEAAVLARSFEFPAWGERRVARDLGARGVAISPSGVRSVWLRHDIARAQHRRRVVELGSAPGRCGLVGGARLGEVPGLGVLWQITFLEGFSRLAVAKVAAAPSVDDVLAFVRDRVVPTLAELGIRLEQIVFAGEPGSPLLQEAEPLSPSIGALGIETARAFQAGSATAEDVLARFHAHVREQFYRPFLRRWTGGSLEALQASLDDFVHRRNRVEPEPGPWTFGVSPIARLEALRAGGLDLGAIGRRAVGC